MVPADEIRKIGVKAGMIRIRDFHGNVTIQFQAPRSRVRNVLWSIFQGMDKTMNPGKFDQLDIHNMTGNDQARISWTEFKKKLTADEPILREDAEALVRPPVEDIPGDVVLSEAVIALLGDGPMR